MIGEKLPVVMISVFSDAVKSQYPQSTENDIIDIIRIWLVKAKERMKNDKYQEENREPISE